MNNGYIAILDSGIGGFSCLYHLYKKLGGGRFLYFGDNKNAPYGNKTAAELSFLIRKNLGVILKYDIKAVVVGCNTLSVSVLPEVAREYPLPFFGVYPPIVQAKGKALLFATPVTCARCEKRENIRVYPLKDLAADIEGNKFRLDLVDINKHLPAFLPDKADDLILGCTHYFFVKNQFINHFCPRTVYSGEEYTAKRVADYFAENGKRAKSENFTVDFVGENAEENYNFYISVVKNMLKRG